MTMPAIVNSPVVEGDPQKILNFAHLAAKSLIAVIKSKPKQFVINNEQYLSFEDWQTVARFYNTTVGVDWTKPVMKNSQTFGYECKAVAYKNGQIISSAEASCSREEYNWADKPAFQIKSMAQTRAMAKCLRNVFAWVVVLAGYKPTPAEEMVDTTANLNSREDAITVATPYDNSRSREWENRPDANRITDKQKNLLVDLIGQKIADEDEQAERIGQVDSLSKWEASEAISELLAA